MRVAGVRELGGPVEVFDLPDPRPLAADEVLMAVKAAGIGNWDDIVRTGSWDVGSRTPMALGVEAAGTILAVGEAVTAFAPGQDVMCHPLQLRHQGTWASLLIAAADSLTLKPTAVSWETAAAFPVPALTAEQVVSEALSVEAGQTLLVHGSGGVTGGLIVQLAALNGATVFATCGAASAARVLEFGAREVFDYTDEAWPDKVLAAAGSAGVQAVANAARGGASLAVTVLADFGRFATITSDPPETERGIEVANVYVRPDAQQLDRLAALLGEGHLSVPIAGSFGLDDVGSVLAKVSAGVVSGAAVAVP
jgi:NADPH:quinone reductase-like Zn-dependent oxidoreductase